MRLAGDTDHRTKTETGAKSAEPKWVRRVETEAAENAPKNAGRRFAMLQVVLQPGMSDNSAKFEETWKSWEHQMDIYEDLSSTKLDDDVKISVVLRECPQKLRDHLLVNSQQFESNYNKLRAIIQVYLNTNKTWIVNDFRETVPIHVDYIGKSKGKSGSNSKGKSKGKSKDRNQGKGKSKINSKSKGKGKPSNDKECYVCGKKGPSRTRLLVTSKPRQDGKRGGGRGPKCRA